MDSKTKYILVADLFNFSKKEIKEKNLISVFPVKKGDGAYRFKYNELFDRSKNQTTLLDNLINEIEPFFKKLPGNSHIDNKVLLYPFITVTFSLLLDRFVRVKERIKSHPNNLEILEFNKPININNLGDIISLSSRDLFFNQIIINKILDCYGFKKTQKKIKFTKIINNTKTKNYNFHENFNKLTFKNLLNKVHILCDRYFPSNSNLLCTSLAYDEFYLRSSGAYGKFGFLTRIDTNKISNDTIRSKKNIKLRHEISNEIKEVLFKNFFNFFKKHKTNLSSIDVNNFINIWLNLFFLWYPEDFIENTYSIHNNLQPSILKNCKGILTTEVHSNETLLLCALLKKNKKKIIGVQHGAGYYGYINDWSVAAHFEYYLYDYFLTNGWVKFEKHLPSTTPLPVPSPRLSNLKSILNLEFFHTLKEFLTGQSKPNKRDILYMPSIFHRFPHASTNGHPRIDYIDDINKLQIDLILDLMESFSIDYKPYNCLQFDLQKDFKQKLHQIEANNFQILDLSMKGLNSFLTRRYSLILWDALGSGAIECFVSGVPSLIFWNKLYSAPSTFSKNIIKGLEDSGIIHSDLNSLRAEILKFKENPCMWRKNYQSNKFIKIFCDNYAKTDQEWASKWRLALGVI